jgi:hypothetical protein
VFVVDYTEVGFGGGTLGGGEDLPMELGFEGLVLVNQRKYVFTHAFATWLPLV